MALAAQGFSVSAIYPKGHPLGHIDVLTRQYRYSQTRPLRSLTSAISDAAPELVIPTDDRSVQHLQALRAAEPKLEDLMRRSVGPAESTRVLLDRYAVLQIAREQGIAVPETISIRSLTDLAAWREPLPWVLKTNGSWGGAGVRTVTTIERAAEAYDSMARPLGPARAIKRLVVNRDGFSIAPCLSRAVPHVIAQRFIPGEPANIAFACWQGRILGAIGVRAIRTQGPTGASTVVEVIEHPAMLEAAQILARKLELSGLHGLDFVLDASGGAWLIEANPRATQLCHIGVQGGADLAARLGAAAIRAALPIGPVAPAGSMIAFFPQAWSGDSADSVLRTASHDVPWEQPALVRDLMLPPWPNRSLLARFWERVVQQDGMDAWAGTAPVQPAPRAAFAPKLDGVQASIS